jgi:hypothetical protein
MKREVIGQQGEVKIYRISEMPACETAKREGDRHVISHSESGHHHVISGDVDVLDRRSDVPPGMEIIYAIVKNPTALRHEAGAGHAEIALDEGIYEFRVSREFDPFAEQARRVTD